MIGPAMTRSTTLACLQFAVRRSALLVAGLSILACLRCLGIEPAILDSVQKILDLPRGSPEQALPVKFSGVVLVSLPSNNICFVQDKTAAIRVNAATNPPPPKSLVTVEGVTTAGFAPEVRAARISVTGTGPFPKAKPITLAGLLLGQSEHQWRQITGIVSSVRTNAQSTQVAITTAGRTVNTQVLGTVTPEQLANWLHQRVSLTGVVVTRVNPIRQLTGAQIIAPSAEQVALLPLQHTNTTDIDLTAIMMESLARGTASLKGLTNPPPEPAKSIAADLMRYGTSSSRVRVIGTVLYQSRPARVYCVDDSGPLRVNLREAADYSPGEQLEIVGFPTSADGRIWLNDAVAVRIGRADLPPPAVLDASVALKGRHDGHRVSLRGRVVGHDDPRLSRASREGVFVEDATGLFRANFNIGTGSLERLPVGTVAEFTGLCVVDVISPAGANSMSVYVSSLADMRILKGPPFWNTRRLTVFAGILVALLAGSAGWLVQQRRQFAIVRSSEEKLEHAALIQTRINEFATSLSPLHSEDDILWEITRQCISVLGFVDCVIYLTDESNATLCQRAAFGPKNPHDRVILDPLAIPVGQGIVGAVAATGKPELIADTRKEPRYIRDDASRLSEIAVPIVAGDRVLGVIDSEHPSPGFFNEDHLAVLGSIASLAANKLVRARAEQRLRELNTDLERRIEERTSELRATNEQLQAKVEERDRADSVQQAIYQISEAVHAVEDLPSLYGRIHSIVGTLMPAENFYLALLDANTRILSFPYHRDKVDPPPSPRLAGRGMTEYVLRTGRATLADWEAIRILKESGDYIQTGHPARIWLGVPLTTKGVTFGVMAVQDHDQADVFGEREKQLLSFVAGQTALAIERKRAEAELRASADRLRQSEEQFSKAFHASPIILSIADVKDGRFIDVNEAFLASLGLPREDVIGRTSLELGIWRSTEERDEFVKTLRAHGSIRNRVFTLTKGEGIRTLMLSAELIVIGSEPCVVSVSADITERQQAEAELLRSLARERDLSQLKSRFVATISHEFRTPLGIVLSSADILDRYFDRLPPEQRREHLHDIQESALGMARQMENVLLFGRIEADRLQCNPAPTNLAALCQRIIQQTSTATEDSSPIRLRHPIPFPTVLADEALISHVITNLLSNAIKYSPKGAPVDCEIEALGDRVALTVRDRGMGIPQRDLEHLFEPFQRGSNVGRVPGTGMGLTIVKRCVELHGGEIHIDSQEQAGTTVTVRWRGFERPHPPTLLPTPATSPSHDSPQATEPTA
jgi:PAS domain S-box-containing protein